MASTAHNQRSAPAAPALKLQSPPEDEPSTASESEAGEEEDESIATTRPRREPRAPQSLYIAPTVLRKRRSTAGEAAERAEVKNKRRRERRKRARESRDMQRHTAVSDEVMAEAEEDDEADDGGRAGFMAAPRSKRRKSLFGTRRKQAQSTSSYAEDGAADIHSGRDSADTLSDDQRRQQEEEEDSRKRRPVTVASSSTEQRLVIHLRVRLKPGRDAGGKFCGVRRYRLDRITGLPDDVHNALILHKQQQAQLQRNGHSQPRQHSDDDDADERHEPGLQSEHAYADRDAVDSQSHTAHASSSSAIPGRPRRSVNVRPERDPTRPSRSWANKSEYGQPMDSLNLPVGHISPGGSRYYGVLPNGTVVIDAQGTTVWPDASTFDYSVFDYDLSRHKWAGGNDTLAVKREVLDLEELREADRETIQRRSASLASSASVAPASTARSPYAQHSLTSTHSNHDTTEHTSRYDFSLLSPPRYTFDASGLLIPPPPPASFPRSPPASRPSSPRVMYTMRSMPSLDYDIANVRAGIHPLYLSALEQIDRLRTERQQGVERLKRERLQHVDDLYTAEMKQVDEEWKDEARGLQQRIIDQLTTQHRHAGHPPHSPSIATTRVTRRRNLLPAGTSRTVLKRYHADYCLPAVERRADVNRCRQLIEEVMGDEEGGELLRRMDERIEKRRAKSGVWRRHTRDWDGFGGGGGRHDEATRAALRAYAAANRQRGANGRFQ